MVLKDFYTILDRSGPETGTSPSGKPVRKYTFSLELNPDHPVYQGHFKGNPVVPGVCQVQIISELLSVVENSPLRIVQADNIKFLTPIVPGKNRFLQVDLEIREGENDLLHVQSVILDKNNTFIKFKGTFAIDILT